MLGGDLPGAVAFGGDDVDPDSGELLGTVCVE
jgi:hypothetical protein